MTPFADKLAAAVANYGPLCVGYDPRFESIPSEYRKLGPEVALAAFGQHVLRIVRPYARILKFQSAFFEQAGDMGIQQLKLLLKMARNEGFVTILDAKRGDIASTAEAYADAAFETFNADGLTVNPYLGEDAVEPFIQKAAQTGGGIFVLVRTSNPGSGLFQNLVSNGKPLYRHVADAVVKWNAKSGNVGAVVGATHPKELAELRAAMPGVWFLVPGYGAQGGTIDDVRPAFPNAIVNSSRAITFPFQCDDANWESKIETAAKKAQQELKSLL